MRVRIPYCTVLLVSVGLAETGLALASHLDAAGAEGSAQALGTPLGFLEALLEGPVEPGSVIALPTGVGQVVGLIQSSASDGDYLTVSGREEGNPNSRFMLKGDPGKVYGWIVLFDVGLAFEYKTSADGEVKVTSVPVEKIFPVCELGRGANGQSSLHRPPPIYLGAPPQWRSQEPHIGDYTGVDLYTLESLPGAPRVLWLDISDSMNGDTPIDFSKEEMWKAWQSVASGYSAFNVNVTTNPEVYAAVSVRDAGVAKFEPTDEWAQCGLGAFGSTMACEIFTGPGAESELGYGVGRTTLHELGHALGLLHDGDASAAEPEYFVGLPAFVWYPIMGNYYMAGSNPEALYQWSIGEYASATNQEDDLEILSQNLPFRDDDIPDQKALQLTEDTQVSSDDNRGQIASNTDTDRFTFSIGPDGGHATLGVTRLEYIGGAMLDVAISLRDSTGTELGRDNPEAERAASLDLELDAGEYELVIEGGEEGTPSNGFSRYSSLGFYGIDGEITGALDSGGASQGGASGAPTDGGEPSLGGENNQGGLPGAGGDEGPGGAPATGGLSSGGTDAQGGAWARGGAPQGGSPVVSGGSPSGGNPAQGGLGVGGQGPGGTPGAGGSGLGGLVQAGGRPVQGGAPADGGSSAVNGGAPQGGSPAVNGGAPNASGGVAPGIGGKPAGSPGSSGDSTEGDSEAKSDDSGCGCRTAPASSSAGAFGWVVAMTLLLARRRNSH